MAAIKIQLFNISKPLNASIILIYGLLCFNWYLIGTQWSPDPHQLPEMECHIEELVNVSWSFYEKRNITTPKNENYAPGCRYYNYQYDYLWDLTYEEAVEETMETSKPEILDCKDITFKSDIPIEVSYIREFDIICYNKRLHLSNIFMDIAMIIFAFPAGVFADMYGRRPVYIFSAIILFVTSFIIPFSTSFVFYAFGKCIQGGCLLSICLVLNLICNDSEICRRKYRVCTTMLAFVWFIVGYNLPNDFFFIIEVWRLRSLAFAVSFLIHLFGAIMITPESPRYLMVKRQFSSAWHCLKELGCTEDKPNLQNIEIRKISCADVVLALEKQCLRRRLYTVIILKGVGVFFYHIFRNMTMEILTFNDKLKFKIFYIQVLLLVGTSIITLTYTKKAMICIHFVLMSLCFIALTITTEDPKVMLMSVSPLAGFLFATNVYIINVTYIIDIFPTAHRGTVLGFTISIAAVISILTQAYDKNLEVNSETDYLGAFYCGVCLICALIAITSTNSSAEIPDKDYDLSRTLSSLNDINTSSVTSTVSFSSF